jgi:cytochrome c biogenesis protein CcmG/thiol:disulfide interchange protein DsbE
LIVRASAGSPAVPAPARASLNRRVLLLGLIVVAGLLAVLLLNLGRDPHSIRSPLVGRTAPAFALPAVGGGAPVTSETLRGRPLVLNFWATWCAPCLQEHETLVSTARALGSDVQFLGVVYEDDEDRVQAFLRRHGSSYPSLMDPGAKAAIAYGVAGVPETYFIDAKGVIRAKVAYPLDPDTMAENIRKVRQ